ncbi:MAG TPA: FecR domain-containing protein [Pyrinomonadaceae bacterium]|nr:FecR domain-containing protein [Pyrinomonadaceae bacterium]
MFSNHVTNELSAYWNGELSVERNREVAEHIIACPRCRAEFEEIKLGVKLLEQLPLETAPSEMWSKIESALGQPAVQLRPRASFWRPQFAAIAAGLVAVILIGVWLLLRDRPVQPAGPSWQVATLNGRPTIGSTQISGQGQLGLGQWLETDQNSSAQINVASIGQVQVDPNTRVRLLQTQPTEHRLELARGKMSARIWAPPRLFFVDTPSAVAADLGCAYTLIVDDSGGSLLRVTSGWVALELKDRESIVPAGAACQTRPGIGPGTPYFEDAGAEFLNALTELDFQSSKDAKSRALNRLLQTARVKDTLTLWHLLVRVEGDERRRVFEKMTSLVELPTDVTREGILKLDSAMLNKWKDKLEFYWVSGGTDPKSTKDLKAGGPLSILPKLKEGIRNVGK